MSSCQRLWASDRATSLEQKMNLAAESVEGGPGGYSVVADSNSRGGCNGGEGYDSSFDRSLDRPPKFHHGVTLIGFALVGQLRCQYCLFPVTVIGPSFLRAEIVKINLGDLNSSTLESSFNDFIVSQFELGTNQGFCMPSPQRLKQKF